MVKKKSTSSTEKHRKVDEDSSIRGDRLQKSTATKDALSAEVTNNPEVMPIAFTEPVTTSIKRTRCRPQLVGILKDVKVVSDSDSLAAEIESQHPTSVRCQPPSAVHQIATRSATGRLAKRPKKEITTQKSTPRKQAKEALTTAEGGSLESIRTRRPWELWSAEDKNLFFEALFEHGKDFDAIQNFMAQKHKKRGGTDSAAKTKDQIRHFYYRTCHKIASYIDLPATDDIKKQALEIYGLVCYGELRRKGLLKMNKMGPRLNELLTQGNTIVRIRGKNQRIKVPTCRALKRLHNVDDQRDESKLKLPEKITLKLHPRTNSAWSHVQMLSQNPRLIIHVQPDQHLSTIFDFLNKKWRLECLQMKEALGEKVEDLLELRLHVPPDSSLTPISINRSNSQPKVDFSFGSFLENIKSLGTSTCSSVSPPNKRTLKMTGPRNEDMTSRSPSLAETAQTVFGCSDTKTAEERPSLPELTVAVPSVASMSVLAIQVNESGTVSVDMDQNACDTSCSEMDCLDSLHHLEIPGVSSDFAQTEELMLSDTAALDAAVALGCGAVDSSCLLSTTTTFATTRPLATTAKIMTNTTLVTTSSCNTVLVKRLMGSIDRTLAEEVTVAELFIMAGRPKELTLDYDWISRSSFGNIVEQSSTGGFALQHLVNIALAEFASSIRMSSSGRLGSMSPPSTVIGTKLDASLSGSKGFQRSPRMRQNPGISRARKESLSMAPDASLDQSANYPWSNASTHVSTFDGGNLLSAVSLAPLCTFSPPSCMNLSSLSTLVTMVTYSSTAAGDGNLPKTLMTPSTEDVFRVPKSLPPKLQTKTGESRTIVDKTVLDGLSIYSSKRSEQCMPRKARTRSTRKPLVVQRTLLPKSQLQTSQIVTLTLVPGVSSAQTGSFLPVACSTELSTQLQSVSVVSETMKSAATVCDVRQNVIKMAPTELKSTAIRRIVPVPIPADSDAIFPAIDNLIVSSSSSSTVTSNVSIGENVHTLPITSESSLPMAITGIDAFLQSSESQEAISVHQGTNQPLASTVAPSFLPSLNDGSLSMPSLLDMSLPEATDSNDRFLDLELMNSNSSFTGLLNASEEKNSSSALTLSNDDSLLSSVKNFQGLASSEETVPWLSHEELSLSSFLPNFASVKKDLEKSLSLPLTVSTTTMQSHVYISESSRDSSLLGGFSTVDGALQSVMNENSLEMACKFNEIFNYVEPLQTLEENGGLRTVASEASDCSFSSNT